MRAELAVIGHHLKISHKFGESPEKLQAQQVQWIQAYIDSLNGRFESVDLLESFTLLFNVKYWTFLRDVKQCAEEIDYGEEALDFILLNHYEIAPGESTMLMNGSVQLSYEAAHQEWKILKQLVKAHHISSQFSKDVKTLASFEDMCMFVYSENASAREYKLPIMKILVTTVGVTHAASAPCESGFSHLEQVKTVHRTSLVQENLDALMYIKLNGPTQAIFETHFLEAVLHTWLDTDAGRQVSIGQHLDKSIFNSLDPRMQHMIRTGTSRLQRERKTQALATVVETRGAPMQWSFGKGRFGNLGEKKRKSKVYAAGGDSSKTKRNRLLPNLAALKSISYLSVFAESQVASEEEEEEEDEEDAGANVEELEEEEEEGSANELFEQIVDEEIYDNQSGSDDDGALVGEEDEDEDLQDGAWRDKAASSRKAEEAHRGISYPVSRSGRTQRQKADDYTNDHLYESYTKRCATRGR